MNDNGLYLDAISGIDLWCFTYTQLAKLEKEGLTKFVGDQHNPEWEWNRKTLSQLSLLQLEQTYMLLKALQAEKFKYTTPHSDDTVTVPYEPSQALLQHLKTTRLSAYDFVLKCKDVQLQLRGPKSGDRTQRHVLLFPGTNRHVWATCDFDRAVDTDELFIVLDCHPDALLG